MQVIIQPSRIQGEISAPTSKSAMQRACAAALVKKGITLLRNPGYSADDKAAMDIIQQLGAQVSEQEGCVRIESKGVAPVSDRINCGESGLSVRMFTPIAALSDQGITVNGGGEFAAAAFVFFQ